MQGCKVLPVICSTQRTKTSNKCNYLCYPRMGQPAAHKSRDVQQMQLFVLSQTGPVTCSTHKQRRPINATICVVPEWAGDAACISHPLRFLHKKQKIKQQRIKAQQKMCAAAQFGILMLQTQILFSLCPEGTCQSHNLA